MIMHICYATELKINYQLARKGKRKQDLGVDSLTHLLLDELSRVEFNKRSNDLIIHAFS